jgi:hypothetical protein
MSLTVVAVPASARIAPQFTGPNDAIAGTRSSRSSPAEEAAPAWLDKPRAISYSLIETIS